MTDLQFETLYELAKNYKYDECQCYANCISKDAKSFLHELWKRVPKSHTKAIMINCAVNGDVYVGKRFTAINESSFGKLVRHFQNGYICVSAFYYPPRKVDKDGNPLERDEDYEERCRHYDANNMAKHKKLKEFMKTAGKDGERLGYIEVAGIYKGVSEISLLVPYVATYTDEEWKDLALKLCKTFKQTCVMYKTPNDDNAYWIYTDGSIENVGSRLTVIRDVKGLREIPEFLTGLKREKNNLSKGEYYRAGGIRVEESVFKTNKGFKYDYAGISYHDDYGHPIAVRKSTLLVK